MYLPLKMVMFHWKLGDFRVSHVIVYLRGIIQPQIVTPKTI